MQQRLVKAGLVFVGHQQHVELVRFKAFRQFLFFDIFVHAGFCVGFAAVRVMYFARKSHQRAHIRIAFFKQIGIQSQLVTHCVQTRFCDHHGLGPAADLVHGGRAEVLHHDFHMLADIVRVQPHKASQRTGGFALGHCRIIFYCLDQRKISLVRHIVGQYVMNEIFFNGLPHGIEMERRLTAWPRLVEHRQSFVFRGCRKGEVAQIGLPRAG